VQPEFFFGEWWGDAEPEAMYELCWILKSMVRKSLKKNPTYF